jgi:hypothetical protein
MTHSPTFTTEPPQSSVGEETARVAVAVITIPETASALFAWTIKLALAASLRRNSIPIIQALPVVNQNFAVAIFVVPRSQRAAALEAIKHALAELELIGRATIALDRAGDSWFTVHGFGANGAAFENGFLRPDYLEASIATFKKWSADCLVIFTAVLKEAEQRSREQGENPDAP